MKQMRFGISLRGDTSEHEGNEVLPAGSIRWVTVSSGSGFSTLQLQSGDLIVAYVAGTVGVFPIDHQFEEQWQAIAIVNNDNILPVSGRENIAVYVVLALRDYDSARFDAVVRKEWAIVMTDHYITVIVGDEINSYPLNSPSRLPWYSLEDQGELKKLVWFDATHLYVKATGAELVSYEVEINTETVVSQMDESKRIIHWYAETYPWSLDGEEIVSCYFIGNNGKTTVTVKPAKN